MHRQHSVQVAVDALAGFGPGCFTIDMGQGHGLPSMFMNAFDDTRQAVSRAASGRRVNLAACGVGFPVDMC